MKTHGGALGAGSDRNGREGRALERQSLFAFYNPSSQSARAVRAAVSRKLRSEPSSKWIVTAVRPVRAA